ncbi:MAG: SOS response-associated peptidase [Candidatus Marinimicrobia bacterium]|nr:SOS response-associated peptidase [Candidatus Neomarinimicrobiota bacterium]MBL7059867.1 SOS response-associated peptidase [Candidatus Neomarinimicrobiota bacterium]
MRSIIEELSIEEWKAPETYAPSYNISPSQHAPILRDTGTRSVRQMQWGLIPSWANDPSVGSQLINARSETILKKPSFQHLVSNRRCIVISDGYYEWKRTGNQKIPYYIRSKHHRLLPMAGLWDMWSAPNGKTIYSYTIITTPPQDALAHIHHRMPAILPYKNLDIWLQHTRSSIDKAVEILAPCREALRAHPVSAYVNSPVNNSIKCIEPVDSAETMDLFE